MVDWGKGGLEVSAADGFPEPQHPGPLQTQLHQCYLGNQSLLANWEGGGRMLVMKDVMMAPLSCSNPTNLWEIKGNLLS